VRAVLSALALTAAEFELMAVGVPETADETLAIAVWRELNVVPSEVRADCWLCSVLTSFCSACMGREA
jgi:hypothetical protein